MKILQIVDTPGWAIDRLAQGVKKYLPHFQFETLYVHPRKVSESVEEFKRLAKWADVIDYSYWNSAKQLLELCPEFKDKPSLLTHHNEKNLLTADWSMHDLIIAETKYSYEVLEKAYPGKVKLIPLAVDLKQFKYRDDLEEADTVGYAGRVVPWKGLKELARACYELNCRLLFMGKFDHPDYWNSIPPEHQAIIDMKYMDCHDDDRKDFYNEVDVFVCNSGPGRETGTMPLMEALASGVPVVSTPSGIGADILQHEVNSLVTPFNDYDKLKANIDRMLEDKILREKLRRAGWQTIKNHCEERRAWEYEEAYHKVLDPDNPLVSVIIPTTPDREGQVNQILNAIEESDYKHMEVIVVTDQLVGDIKVNDDKSFGFPIKHLFTKQDKIFGLAMARNMAAIEAHGKYLVFCDSRMKPLPQSIAAFVNTMRSHDNNEKVWMFGNKGTGKKTFVENFSCIKRADFIKAGMCNERIDRYGGMSQELRTRFQSQGFQLVYVESAEAEQISSSHLTNERREDIVASKLKLFKMGL
ncbi:MAG: glycosyltransferase [Candidatus Levybacteria bacterium]|nr:glycosyltransferase [Candidatus Levybacteria bacterium]